MTWMLIAVNLLVFVYELTLPQAGRERLLYGFGVVPALFSSPELSLQIGLPSAGVWTFFTSMFLHGGFLHVASNLWTLWIFGDNVEDRMGPFRFLLFYLVSGLAAGVVHLVTHFDSAVPTVGASGAIAGVLGAYMVLYPRSRVLTLVPVFFWPLFFEIPAFFYLGFWFVAQLFSAATAGTAGVGVAWWAHVGGFLTGLLVFRLFLRARPRRRPPSLLGV